MMKNNFDYITVNKVLFQGSGFVCLQSYENDSSLTMPLSAIKKISLYDKYSYKETILTTNITLTDVTVTSFGTIWAIDVLGHLYRLNPRGGGVSLDSTCIDKNMEAHTFGLNWSIQGITQQTPVCIIGENDDLWIATQEGGLIHYDGGEFTQYTGIKQPIRFKRLNGCYYLMGYHRQLMQYKDGKWQMLSFDALVPEDIPINDLTYINEQLLAVSNLGHILYQKVDGAFSTLLNDIDIPWFGCDTYQNTVYLAGGCHGAYQLGSEINNFFVDSKTEVVKASDIELIKKGHFVSVTVLGHRVMYLQALTASANFVCHIPFGQKRWFLVKT